MPFSIINVLSVCFLLLIVIVVLLVLSRSALAVAYRLRVMLGDIAEAKTPIALSYYIIIIIIILLGTL